MINPTPKFTFTPQYTLTRWYGHVHLLPDRILGQWFCLDRETGRLIWENKYHRPNTLCAVNEGVIVATEVRSDGPWTLDFGVYGISLETGRLIWTSHGAGAWGKFLRFLDFVPGFTNDLRDIPAWVDKGQCITGNRRILNVHTGQRVGILSKDEFKIQKPKEQKNDARILYDGLHANDPTRVKISEKQWLTHKLFKEVNGSGFTLHIVNDMTSALWSFNLKDTQYHMDHPNYYAYRFACPYVYIVASEEPSIKPIPGRPNFVAPNPANFHLLTLDLTQRKIVQDLRIGDQKYETCRIEDIDDHALLISAGSRELRSYARQSSI